MTAALEPNELFCRLIQQIGEAGVSPAALSDAIEQTMRQLFKHLGPDLLQAAAPLHGLAEVGPEDAVQDALSAFARRLREPEFRLRMMEGRPWSFLRRMVRNRALDIRDAHVARRQTIRRLIEAEDTSAHPAAQPEEHLVAARRRSAARRLLDGLSEDDRRIVTLFYIEGRSSRDVGLAVGRSATDVRQRARRALVWLRRRPWTGEEELDG